MQAERGGFGRLGGSERNRDKGNTRKMGMDLGSYFGCTGNGSRASGGWTRERSVGSCLRNFDVPQSLVWCSR